MHNTQLSRSVQQTCRQYMHNTQLSRSVQQTCRQYRYNKPLSRSVQPMGCQVAPRPPGATTGHLKTHKLVLLTGWALLRVNRRKQVSSRTLQVADGAHQVPDTSYRTPHFTD
jgi:hypothetical protein